MIYGDMIYEIAWCFLKADIKYKTYLVLEGNNLLTLQATL